MINIIKGFWLWVFTGRSIIQEERLLICEKCSPYTLTCPICKCFKEPKAKVPREKCPLNKW